MRKYLGAALALAAASLVGCGSTAASTGSASKSAATVSSSPAKNPPAASSSHASLTPVTFSTDYTPVGDEIPFVYGVTSGIYKKYGLDVKLSFGTGSATETENAAAGKIDFGEGDAASVLLLRAKNVPATMVMGIEQQNPLAVLVPTKSSITSAKDLVGKSIGGVAGSQGNLLLPAYLKANGLSMNQVHLDNMSPSALLQALIKGNVNTILDFGTDIPPFLATKGLPTRSLYFSKSGVNPINLGIVVSGTYLKSHPKTVQAFVTATQAAFQATEKNPQAAVAAVESFTKVAPPAKVLLQQWQRSVPFLTTANDAAQPFGWMSVKDWKATAQLVTTYFGASNVATANAYTNQFIH